MDVADWLRTLGLQEYEAIFRQNHIDAEVLPTLGADDLRELGISSLGHRKRLLAAIAALADHSSVTTSPKDAHDSPVSGSTTGERRYLTVMFCDLVGSTGISARLDAEEWRDLVSTYLDAATAATEMGGHVAKKLGDGLLALFGYPVAHENDAERAARAALSIQRALAELNRRNISSGRPELAAALGSKAAQRFWTPQARFAAMSPISPRTCRHWPNPARCWSRRRCIAMSPGCSWPRSAARTRSKACRSRPRYFDWSVPAAAVAAQRSAGPRRSLVATTKWRC
jgi:hypothetical protein